MNTEGQNQIIQAMYLAKTSHGKQLRKYTNEPYIVHPFAVAGLVCSVEHTAAMVCAAILHDTVEDTDVTISNIGNMFSAYVADLVWWVTDASTPSDGNRATRKQIDLNHLAKAPPEAQTIKLADLIDNTKSIALFDRGFAKGYLLEKRALLNVLINGDPQLYNIAQDLAYKEYK